MSNAIKNLLEAQQMAMNNRSQTAEGFPYLAAVLRKAGVLKNIWTLPACQSVYLTKDGPVVMLLKPLVTEPSDIPAFNREKFIEILRLNQAGKTSFPEFLQQSWLAGVISYEVDFEKRKVIYFGCLGECYTESYPDTPL